jgi:hypothetical protein
MDSRFRGNDRIEYPVISNYSWYKDINMNKVQEAVSVFHSGFNCTQAI